MAEITKTKLVAANTTKSLRCTVPAHVISMLNLQEGDQFEWKINPVKSSFKVELVPVRNRTK